VEPSRPRDSSSSQHARDWRRYYQAVVQETNIAALFKQIEIAEAAIRVRRESLMFSMDHPAERQEIEAALAHILSMKRTRLGLPRMDGDSENEDR
jgi:hypothetical protein